jgi:hypothetical protein
MAPRKKASAAAATPPATPAPAPATNYGPLLSAAVAALTNGQPLMATHAEMAPLVNYEGGHLVECNEAVKDGDKVAWRASARGVEAHKAGWLGSTAAAPNPGAAGGFTAPAQSAAPAPASAPANSGPTTFTFDDGIPIPEPKRGGGRGSDAYGFEHMNIGQSFHIPATTENPNPAKRIASTVSSATKRLAPKAFIVRSVDEKDPKGKGARVFRTADAPAVAA